MSSPYARPDVDIAWCPGCGNFAILRLLKQALEELGLDKRQTAIVSGIGQAAKTPHYIDVHMYNGLHGRALPVATALKSVNPSLTVIAEGGDGDMYGEGGNHFLAAVRRNVDLLHIVHNNMVYGLTKGQASPTSQPGFTTPVQVKGVTNRPFNPIATAISLGATFVSRVSTGSIEHAVHCIKEALLHPGYALVDIFQPCPTFNRVNTHQWFKDNTYLLEESGHDPHDLAKAFARAMESEQLPIGIFYKQEHIPTFENNLWHGYDREAPIWERRHDLKKIQEAFERFR